MFPLPSTTNRVFLVCAVAPAAAGAAASVDLGRAAETDGRFAFNGETLVGTAVVSGPPANVAPALLRQLRLGQTADDVARRHGAALSDVPPVAIAEALRRHQATTTLDDAGGPESPLFIPAKPRFASITDVFVIPSHRGHGLGAQLVRAAAVLAAAEGFVGLEGTAAENGLVAWYRRLLGPAHAATASVVARGIVVPLSEELVTTCRAALAGTPFTLERSG